MSAYGTTNPLLILLVIALAIGWWLWTERPTTRPDGTRRPAGPRTLRSLKPTRQHHRSTR